jgi:hypothetical protein
MLGGMGLKVGIGRSLWIGKKGRPTEKKRCQVVGECLMSKMFYTRFCTQDLGRMSGERGVSRSLICKLGQGFLILCGQEKACDFA